jgi:hypothetical protein
MIHCRVTFPIVPNIRAADPRGRDRLARFVAERDRTFAQRLGPEGSAVESV